MARKPGAKTKKPSSASRKLTGKEMEAKGRLDRRLEQVLATVPPDTREYLEQNMGVVLKMDDMPPKHLAAVLAAEKRKKS